MTFIFLSGQKTGRKLSGEQMAINLIFQLNTIKLWMRKKDMANIPPPQILALLIAFQFGEHTNPHFGCPMTLINPGSRAHIPRETESIFHMLQPPFPKSFPGKYSSPLIYTVGAMSANSGRVPVSIATVLTTITVAATKCHCGLLLYPGPETSGSYLRRD